MKGRTHNHDGGIVDEYEDERADDETNISAKLFDDGIITGVEPGTPKAAGPGRRPVRELEGVSL